MYTGVRSFEDAQRVTSFATAKAALERASRTPTGKRRTEKRWGFHLGMSRNHGVTWVREADDETICFRLYDTDVVIWHADNSVEIDNFGSVTTSAFAERFLPAGMHLAYPVERRGSVGGHRRIYYRVEDGSRWGRRMVCFGGMPRFREVDGDWRPDADTIDAIKFPELDRKLAREISREVPWKDFENWLSMAPHHMRIEHDCWDLDDCMAALRKRDFTLASMFLPLITIPNGFGGGDRITPLPIITKSRDHVVTMGSLQKLRLALYADRGAYDTIELTEIDCDEFDRRMARVRQLCELDAARCTDYGPYA